MSPGSPRAVGGGRFQPRNHEQRPVGVPHPAQPGPVTLQGHGMIDHRRLIAAEDQAAPFLFVPVLLVAGVEIARADEVGRPAAAEFGIGCADGNVAQFAVLDVGRLG